MPSESTNAKAMVVSQSLYQDLNQLSLKRYKSDKPYIFLAHGTRNLLIPMTFFRKTKERLECLLTENAARHWGREIGHEYEDMGHGTYGREFLDLCSILKRVLPAQ